MSPNGYKITVSKPTEINSNKANGVGWTLELKDGCAVQKKESSNHYVLTKTDL